MKGIGARRTFYTKWSTWNFATVGCLEQVYHHDPSSVASHAPVGYFEQSGLPMEQNVPRESYRKDFR
jgi:hypothetical protein